jgi:Acetyltransferase (isoleucine patch superfamily)
MKERLMQLKSYGFLKIISMGISFIRTRLFYKPALFIFFPLDIRGKRYIQLGDKMTCGRGCRLEAYPNGTDKKVLMIGRNVQINDYVHITAVSNVSIGDNVLFASRIYISDVQHGNYSNIDPQKQSSPETIAKERELSSRDVIIEDNVWLGEGVCVLPGVTVGRCSIIGANAVVTKDIPAYCIAAGNPAKIIKKFNAEINKWEKWNGQ